MMDNNLKEQLNAVMFVSDTLLEKTVYQHFGCHESATIAQRPFIELSRSTLTPTCIVLFIDSIEPSSTLSLLNAAHLLLNAQGVLFIPSKQFQHHLYLTALLLRLGFVETITDLTNTRYKSWQKVRPPHWQLSFSDDRQQPLISALFQQVFEHPLSAAMWQWKYADNRGHAVLASKESHLVGHYGGMCRDVYIANQRTKALQIGDVMVAKSERGIFSKRGLFFQMCATFLEQYIGGEQPYALGYGFPTERAMRIAEHQGLYRQIDRMVEKHWPPLDTRPSIFHTIRPLSNTASQKTRQKIEYLWRQMLNGFSQSIIGVRDWDYLCHRYFNHPEKAYNLYYVNQRFTNKPIGVIVLANEGERCRLMDLIGPLQSFTSLIHHAQRLAHHLNTKQLFAWTTLSHQAIWPSEAGQAIDVCIPSSAWTPQSPLATEDNQWWLTAGDTDFC